MHTEMLTGQSVPRGKSPPWPRDARSPRGWRRQGGAAPRARAFGTGREYVRVVLRDPPTPRRWWCSLRPPRGILSVSSPVCRARLSSHHHGSLCHTKPPDSGQKLAQGGGPSAGGSQPTLLPGHGCRGLGRQTAPEGLLWHPEGPLYLSYFSPLSSPFSLCPLPPAFKPAPLNISGTFSNIWGHSGLHEVGVLLARDAAKLQRLPAVWRGTRLLPRPTVPPLRESPNGRGSPGLRGCSSPGKCTYAPSSLHLG